MKVWHVPMSEGGSNPQLVVNLPQAEKGKARDIAAIHLLTNADSSSTACHRVVNYIERIGIIDIHNRKLDVIFVILIDIKRMAHGERQTSDR